MTRIKAKIGTINVRIRMVGGELLLRLGLYVAVLSSQIKMK